MDCIILAGGFGTRLKKTVPVLPKSLALIQGKPFLELLLQQIASWKSIDRIIFSLGYKADMIRNFLLSKTTPFEMVFSVENQPLGTGGATRKAFNLSKDDQAIVLNGDTYFDVSLMKLFHTHKEKKADITIACAKVSDSSRYGLLQIDTHSGKIISFQEKTFLKKEGIINGGIYCIQKSVFQHIPFRENFSLENDVFPSFLHRKMYSFISSGMFIDIGTRQSFFRAQQILKPLV